MLSDSNWTILAGFVVTRSMVLRTKGHENVSFVIWFGRISKTLRRKCVMGGRFWTFLKIALRRYTPLTQQNSLSKYCMYLPLGKTQNLQSTWSNINNQRVFQAKRIFFCWSSREVSQTPSRQASISINEISSLSKYSWCSVHYNTIQ